MAVLTKKEISYFNVHQFLMRFGLCESRIKELISKIDLELPHDQDYQFSLKVILDGEEEIEDEVVDATVSFTTTVSNSGIVYVNRYEVH